MYTVRRTMEIAASHKLRFSDSGTEEPLHGHNWKVTLWCRCVELDHYGMVPGTAEIEQQIFTYLDHCDLNATLPCSPTTEHLANWVLSRIESCFRVEVQECEGNIAVYEKSSDE